MFRDIVSSKVGIDSAFFSVQVNPSRRLRFSAMAAGVATLGKHRAYVGGTLAANPMSSLAGYTAISEIARTNACEIAGRAGDRLTDGLKMLLDKYALPFVAYNQGSIVHLECSGAMSFDYSSFCMKKKNMARTFLHIWTK